MLKALKSDERAPCSPQQSLTCVNHLQLAMGILGSLFGGAYYAASGPKKPIATATPPINAGSSDEADFITYVAPPRARSNRTRTIGVHSRRQVANSIAGSSSSRPRRNKQQKREQGDGGALYDAMYI